MIDNSDPPHFRDLYEAITICKRDVDDLDNVLVSWLPKAEVAIAALSPFREMICLNSKEEHLYGVWNLYALSRINDYLIDRSQLSPQHSASSSYLYDTWLQFMERLGFSWFDGGRSFHPFNHEICGVLQSFDPDEPIEYGEYVWPGFRFGKLLFSRSGIIVRGGRNFICKKVAESSTLYFTYRRPHRRTADLSMGWGHNSQWRTSFRRDYECDGRFYYNVDGKDLLSHSKPSEPDRDGLTPNERIELCRNRCFIKTTKAHDDLWPYDDRFEEIASGT